MLTTWLIQIQIVSITSLSKPPVKWQSNLIIRFSMFRIYHMMVHSICTAHGPCCIYHRSKNETKVKHIFTRIISTVRYAVSSMYHRCASREGFPMTLLFPQLFRPSRHSMKFQQKFLQCILHCEEMPTQWCRRITKTIIDTRKSVLTFL